MAGPVFLNFDQAALDSEYDNQTKVPQWRQIRTGMDAASAAVRSAAEHRLDQRYGPLERERLDIFLPPAAAAPAPVHLFFHGGYWLRNDKSGSSYMAPPLTAVGAVAVVVNYPLIPSAPLDVLVHSARAAVAWVYHNAAAFGGDLQRITVSGHSAGGHLAAMVLATDWTSLGLPAGLVRAACAVSGLYDLEPVRLCSQNAVLGLDRETAQRNSPVLQPAPVGARLLLAVGATEGKEFHRQARALRQAWGDAGVAVEVLDLAGENHFSIAASLGDPASRLTRALLELVGAAHG